MFYLPTPKHDFSSVISKRNFKIHPLEQNEKAMRNILSLRKNIHPQSPSISVLHHNNSPSTEHVHHSRRFKTDNDDHRARHLVLPEIQQNGKRGLKVVGELVNSRKRVRKLGNADKRSEKRQRAWASKMDKISRKREKLTIDIEKMRIQGWNTRKTKSSNFIELF